MEKAGHELIVRRRTKKKKKKKKKKGNFGVTGSRKGDNCSLNPQSPDGYVYKPPLVYCRMGFINTPPFPALHLSRNVAKVSESLKISDQRMAKLC